MTCARCGSGVYEAEDQITLNKIWHKCCFSCRCCNTKLDKCTAKIFQGLVVLYLLRVVYALKKEVLLQTIHLLLIIPRNTIFAQDLNKKLSARKLFNPVVA
nr:uncharacterized protein LOC111514702 [Leptinotarsa decemlineata]